MLFRRLILCAVAIGVVAGVVLGLAEQVTTAPLIEAAEQYEVADHAAAGHHHHDHAWAPADGGQRVFFTVVASIGVAIGFALMLLVAMSLARALHGRATTPLRGLVWGAGAFGVVFVAPALGLAPELPGAPAADLAARQLWWIATVGLVGFSLWTVIFVPGRMKWAALLLLPLPYLYGAPLPSAEPGSTNAALVTLHQQFVWATAGTNLVLWVILGVLCGWAMQRWIAPALINTPRPEPARA